MSGGLAQVEAAGGARGAAALFRFHDGGVRHHPPAVERDRRGQGGGGRPAAASARGRSAPGILFFPVSYVLGDVLTEVYGYARARRCIWAGFAAMLFMAFMSLVVVALPPAADWTGQAAYEQVFGQVPRIVFASICAFWAGEFVNSYVLAQDEDLDARAACCGPARSARRSSAKASTA